MVFVKDQQRIIAEPQSIAEGQNLIMIWDLKLFVFARRC